MRIRLEKTTDGHEAGTVIEVEDGAQYIKDGHTLYTGELEQAEKQALKDGIKDAVRKETMETKEVKQEITAPAVVIHNEKRIEGAGDLFQKIGRGETKMVNFETKAPSGMNEDTANADGGFLVSHDINDAILGRMIEGGKLYPDCQHIELGPNYNGRKLPFLNITTQTTAAQPVLYSLAEGAQKTPTKFTFGQHDLALVKLIALVPITEELLQDKTTLESYVFQQIKGKFAWTMDYNTLYGTAATTGNIGILDATGAAFLSTPVAHAATPTVTMVNQVINGVDPWVRDGAEFYVSGDMWANIMAALGPGVANLLVPIAREEGGNRTLQGYPVNLMNGMTAHNTAKDLVFGNPKEIVFLEKGGLMIDLSKEFYFDTDQIALRFVLRQASAPVWAKYTAVDGKDYAAWSATS